MTTKERDITTATVGDIAPDLSIAALDGPDIQLREWWTRSRNGLALIFLRHYGCPFCREHARQVESHKAEFAGAGIDVVLIGCGTLEEAAAFRSDLGLTLPIGNDPDRDAYRAFGLGEATAGSMLNPTLLLGGIRALARGNMPRRSSGHPMQLQGQFLIDPQGIVRMADRPTLMSDIPSATELLRTARSLA